MSSANLRHNPATMAAPTNNLYSHGVEVPAGSRRLYVAGQVGTRPDGTIAGDLDGQVEQIMTNIEAILADAGMDLGDVVKLNAYCLKSEDIMTYAALRNRYFKGAPPATTAVVVAGLALPEWLIEVDAVAEKTD
ncbi:RidA family protein [Arenibaculum sp.]|uniref:RidA family protein n=1 Tax=Arenibaculum sp. TaxID=2865862 RepID=UPI002E0E2270|nr:RidA family protein [Arenibaculum sp.]